MHVNLEKSAIEDAVKIIADDLAAIQITLEELYRSNEEHFSNQAISNDFESAYVILGQLRLALNKILLSVDEVVLNGLEEAASLGFQYAGFLRQLKSKYREFIINDKLFIDLEYTSSCIERNARITSAFSYLDRGINRGDSELLFEYYCKGMILLSEAVEYGINLDRISSLPFDRGLLQKFKNIATHYLASLEEAPVASEFLPASQNDIAQVLDLVLCKNAAQSILWQIDSFEKDVNSLNSTTSSEAEELELVEKANQAMMEAWDLISQRQNSETDAQANL